MSFFSCFVKIAKGVFLQLLRANHSSFHCELYYCIFCLAVVLAEVLFERLVSSSKPREGARCFFRISRLIKLSGRAPDGKLQYISAKLKPVTG